MYRVEHKFISGKVFGRDFNPGPYKIGRFATDEKQFCFSKINLQKLDKLLALGEPSDKFAKDAHGKPVTSPLPPMWKHPRPGPNEDPYLKDFFYKLSPLYKKRYIFGFETMESLYSWFYDDELISLMKNLGFACSKYTSRYITHDLRQSVMSCEREFYKKNYKNLLTKAERFEEVCCDNQNH